MIRKRTILSLALLATTAACGGGGGGSPAASGPAPAVSGGGPAQSAATAPSTNVANPQVTMTPDGKMSFASDQISQTVTNDENNVLTVHVAGVVDQSFDFTNDPANTTVFNVDNSPFVQIDKVDANGNKVTAIKFNDGSQLNATTFGIWQKFDQSGTMTASGAFAIGTDTPADQMPTSGKATYAGNAIGTGQDGTGSFTLTGTSNVSADFGNRSVTTDISLNKGDQQFVALHSADGAIAANSNKFAGSIQGGGLSGGIQGAFFGTSANQRGAAGEVGGVFAASGGGTSVNGSFAAAQTSRTP